MDTTEFSSILDSILLDKNNEPIHLYSSVEWIERVFKPYLPIDKMELSLSKLPGAFRQILTNIVIDGARVVSNIVNPYTFRPNIYEIIGVVRSNGDCQLVVVTSILSLDTNNTIHFLDIPSFLEDETNNVLIKSDIFFYLPSDREVELQFKRYPDLSDKIDQQKEFLKKYDNDIGVF